MSLSRRSASPASGLSRDRCPALDGLRGIAILGVLLFHTVSALRWDVPSNRALSAWPGTGWMGVDIFFVISGFLITGVLLDTRHGEARFRNFYARRFLRIIPVYYLLLVIVFLVLPRIMSFDSAGLHTIRHRQAWLWTHLTNLSFVFYRQVWTQADTLDLNHLWSLAVEEQFYLLWPLAVFFLNRRWLTWTCIGCIVTSLALRIVLWQAGQRNGAIYFPTPCRLDGLAMGALVAVLIREPGRIAAMLRGARVVGALALAGLAALARGRGGLAFTDKPTAVFGIALVSLLSACVVALVSQPERSSSLASVLRTRFLRTTGKYSYGLYLFHGVLLAPLVALMPPDRLVTATGSELAGNLTFITIFIAISYAVALLSWHAYEKHWLRLKSRFDQSPRVRGYSLIVSAGAPSG